MGRRNQEDWGAAEEAAQWLQRLKAPDVERHRRSFDHWLEESAEHHREFILASLTDMQMDALRRHASQLRLGTAEALQSKVVPIRRASSETVCNTPPPTRATSPRMRSAAAVLYAAAIAVLIFGLLFTYGVVAGGTVHATAI